MENRAIIFFIIFIIFFILERAFPRFKDPLNTVDSRLRKACNLLLIAIGNLLVRIILPMGGVGFALYCQQKNLGIFSYFKISQNLNTIVSVILLDFIIYWQHRLFHVIPLFWKIHRVHHMDPFLDVTSGLRFHPIEILLSMFIKFFFILILGVSPAGVLIFEMILNGMAVFNHSNLAIKKRLDRVLQLLFVTPDFHVIHHSKRKELFNSNYGFNLSFWDKIFKSYIPCEKFLNKDFEVGLNTVSNSDSFNLKKILKSPFKN
jgi:sterol desaturase/sphingolipid hydroxylase (fatty acid hydroxylase superfamily)